MCNNKKPTLICQDCGWEGTESECVVLDGDHDQELMLCQNCWGEEFLEIEHDPEFI